MSHSTTIEPTSLAVGNIAVLALQRARDPLWVSDAGTFSWAQFGAAVVAVRRQCETAGVAPGDVVVTPGDSTFDALAWLFGVAMSGAVAAPLRWERLAELRVWKGFLEIGWRVWEGRLVRVREGTKSPEAVRLFDELRLRQQPGLILATGGTTGIPKLVLHDLTALLGTVPLKETATRRMLPLMRFDHIGGLDMAWRALAGRQVLVAPPLEITPVTVAELIARHRVEVLPATPSFLNLLLLAGVHRTHDLSSLRVVPYGAEPMPAGLLARLRTALRRVEFVQRFGTSETGALPVQDEGKGVVLRGDQKGFSWKLVEGELWVKSPARALGYLAGDNSRFEADGWFRTGDVAEQLPGGSIRVLGRREELINVGGEKVLPGEVEAVLMAHHFVADCRIGPEENAVLGQVVAADIIWSGPETDALAVKRVLHAYAAGLLPRHKLPTVVRLVTALDATGNLKKQRKSNS